MLTTLIAGTWMAPGQLPEGQFPNRADIGRPSRAGSATVDPQGAWVVTGGGENMWFTNDAFHFAWTNLAGDFSLSAAVEWIGAGGNAHRKACLMIRQTPDADSPYVDVAVHGDGLTSLQWRSERGGPTREIQANVSRPPRVGIERQGNAFFLRLPGPGRDALVPGGAFTRVRLTDPVCVGLAVCAHDEKALETARFSGVALVPRKAGETKPVLHSTLETISIASRDRRVVYTVADHIEAPNWSPDGSYLLFNSHGSIFRLATNGNAPVKIDTGFANKCNNDHGLSFDGAQLAISDQSANGKSLIYVLPAAGGTPRLVTPLGPSYWHGWSPDGQTLVYCAERNGEYDVYSIPTAGGEEKRLTQAKGLDDGPEYTPDSKWIYFNSNRTGTMHIWRMKPDGSNQEQVTHDEFNNWFAHPSPDGKWIVFLSYEKGVEGHPHNHPVKLRLMPVTGGSIQELASLFGGQGTINVPSWSPDSRHVAFVSYELIQP